MSSSTLLRAASAAARASSSRQWLHTSAARSAITNFQMPAMSPTMTEGGIASWKLKEGDKFAAGDVLLEIETDKATIDVEAQDDGIVGKIILQDGAKNIPVGKVIALLAEEGDDISNLEAPKEESSPESSAKQADAPPTSQPAPPEKPATEAGQKSDVKHHVDLTNFPRIFPSVARLLSEHDFPLEKVKGTGLRGMITKGDVLAYLGKASSPTGTFKQEKSALPEPNVPKKKDQEVVKPLDGPALRRAIMQGMYQKSVKARNAAAPPLAADFDSIIADYLPPKPSLPSFTSATTNTVPPSKAPVDILDALL
ncbi:single hybrid motif-containing protein [Peniophora sp. CONT]|nr:single hybrid motif-containing protein [Peniophora sp. CONT]